MIKRKCPGCAEKVNKKYNYCPWCSFAIKGKQEEDNFGLLGRNDQTPMPQQSQPTLPFGLDKMVNNMVKQLEKEFQNTDMGNMPKGFNIKIQTGLPQQLGNIKQAENKHQNELPKHNISKDEEMRRQKLPKQQAEAKVKRIADKIIYEIETPGIQKVQDIVINKLAEGFEVRAYTKDTCYLKTIPLDIEIHKYSIQNNKVIIECNN